MREIDLLCFGPLTLILIEPKHFLAVFARYLCRIKALAGIGRMSDYTYIPLNTAAEPRISDRKIAKTNNIVVIEQIFTRLFIDKFP